MHGICHLLYRIHYTVFNFCMNQPERFLIFLSESSS